MLFGVTVFLLEQSGALEGYRSWFWFNGHKGSHRRYSAEARDCTGLQRRPGHSQTGHVWPCLENANWMGLGARCVNQLLLLHANGLLIWGIYKSCLLGKRGGIVSSPGKNSSRMWQGPQMSQRRGINVMAGCSGSPLSCPAMYMWHEVGLLEQEWGCGYLERDLWFH